jgi:hypothetical protein
MSLSLIRRAYLTWQSTRKNGLLVLDSESAAYFAQTARLQAFTQQIGSLESLLPRLRAAVDSASAKLTQAQAELSAVVSKLDSARAERDRILGRSDRKLLEAKQCQLTES